MKKSNFAIALLLALSASISMSGCMVTTGAETGAYAKASLSVSNAGSADNFTQASDGSYYAVPSTSVRIGGNGVGEYGNIPANHNWWNGNGNETTANCPNCYTVAPATQCNSSCGSGEVITTGSAGVGFYGSRTTVPGGSQIQYPNGHRK